MDPLLQENFIYVFVLIFCISFYEILTSALSRSFLDAITPVVLNEFFKNYTLIILLFSWVQVY